MKKKIDLLIVIILINLIAVITTVIFVHKFGFIKIDRQIVSFLLSITLSYFLYIEKQWARQIFVILFSFAGIMAIRTSIEIVSNQSVSNIIFIIFMSLVYIVSAIYIGFIRKWKNSIWHIG